MQIDITTILVALIGLAGTLASVMLVPWLKARTTAEQWSTIILWAKAAVKAAEVLYGAGQGQDKLNYALDWVSDLCAGAGFAVDKTKLRTVIEQEWLDLTNSGEINRKVVQA